MLILRYVLLVVESIGPPAQPGQDQVLLEPGQCCSCLRLGREHSGIRA